MRLRGNEKLTPEKAVGILKKEGLEVTAEQARQILEFLYKMADITLSVYLKRPP